jgi:hypothetical protein
MSKKISVISAVVVTFAFAGSASAGSAFQDRVNQCLERHANTHDAASVTLQCDAKDGKLSGCSVVENTAPGRGFDKAAMCVADALPMGAKVGQIKIPVRFTGGN